MKLIFAFLLLLPVLLFAQSEVEPNNTQSTATPLVLGQAIEGFIGVSRDEDYYSLPITEPGILKVVVTGVAGVDFRAFVYLPDGATQVFTRAQTAEGAALIFEISLCSVGDHLLYLSDEFGIGGNQGTGFNADEPYRLTASFTPFAGIDDCECENETLAQACRIEPGTIITALLAPYFRRVGNQATHDFDNYKVNMTEPGTVRIKLMDVPPSIDMNMEVYGPDRATRIISRQGAAGTGFTVEFSACESGDYYIAFEDNRGVGNRQFDSQNPYSFSVELLPFAGIDNCECSNETLTQACEIQSGQEVSALISPRFNFEQNIKDKDAYFIQVDEPSVLKLNLTTVPANLTLNIKVIGPDRIEKLLDRNATLNSLFRTEFSLCTPGKYYLTFEDQTIFNNRFNAEAPYLFNLTLAALSETDPSECDNNTFASAPAISLCDTVRATIGPPTTYESNAPDEDYYKISLDANTTYRFLLTNIPTDLNPRIYLYDNNRTEVERFLPQAGGTTNTLFTPASSGSYFVRVFETRQRFSSDEQYLLQIGCNTTTAVTSVSLKANNIYPNPTNGLLTIDLTGYPELQSATLSMFNAAGVRVNYAPLDNAKHSLNTAGLTPGIYHLRISSPERVFTGRVVVQ